mmetsp:Transcript_99032/g.295851  ORF Transcript_99032/g.295851 Transcript_99032/m.295851 type:complete len:242 (+) Transcript_99032:1051-1776(+)
MPGVPRSQPRRVRVRRDAVALHVHSGRGPCVCKGDRTCRRRCRSEPVLRGVQLRVAVHGREPGGPAQGAAAGHRHLRDGRAAVARHPDREPGRRGGRAEPPAHGGPRGLLLRHLGPHGRGRPAEVRVQARGRLGGVRPAGRGDARPGVQGRPAGQHRGQAMRVVSPGVQRRRRGSGRGRTLGPRQLATGEHRPHRRRRADQVPHQFRRQPAGPALLQGGAVRRLLPRPGPHDAHGRNRRAL